MRKAKSFHSRPKKSSKKILKTHFVGGYGCSPIQQGNITSPATAGPGTSQSVSATGTTTGTVAGP